MLTGNYLHYVTGRLEENNVSVLQLNVSSWFALVKKVVFNVDCAETPKSPAVAMSTKAFELQNSSQESSNHNKYFVPLFFKESINSKFTPCTNSRFSISHNTVKKLGLLIEKVYSVKLWLKCSNF